MTKIRVPRSKWQLAFTWLLLAISIYGMARAYPFLGWLICATLGFHSLLAILLGVGWVIPCAIAGAYAGLAMQIIVPPIIDGPGAYLHDTLEQLMYFTIAGLFIGWMVDDAKQRNQNKNDRGKC